MKALLDLFKQVTQEEEFDAINVNSDNSMITSKQQSDSLVTTGPSLIVFLIPMCSVE